MTITWEGSVEGQGWRLGLGRGREQVADGGHAAAADPCRCRCQCAGSLPVPRLASKVSEAELEQSGRWRISRISLDQCGSKLCAVQQDRCLWTCIAALVVAPAWIMIARWVLILHFTALLPLAGRGWKASNHLWSGTRLFWDTRPCWLLIPLPRRQCGEGGHWSQLLGCWARFHSYRSV